MTSVLKRNIIKSFAPPNELPEQQKKNFVNVEVDAVGVGLANAANPFLPVFLTRLNASSFEVGMLTSMPALTGLLLSIPLGRFLQRQTKIIPWFSLSRLLIILCYALTGVVAFFFSQHNLVIGILVIWALATIPQSVLSITFSVVMNAVAGPQRRFDLMTRRWSILGFTTAVTVFFIGQILDLVSFPVNYQMTFIALSLGGLLSYYFSSHIVIADNVVPETDKKENIKNALNEYFSVIKKEPAFLSFIFKRFIFLTGTAISIPLFPLYYVREVHASDGWIAAITMSQTAILIVGYNVWAQRSRAKGTRNVLLLTTFAISFYPILVSMTHQIWLIVLFSGLAGFFQAGVDLVFFDELFKTVPPEYSATFVSFAQSAQYISSIIGPLVGTALSGVIGTGGAIAISGIIRLLGFLLFAKSKPLVTAY